MFKKIMALICAMVMVLAVAGCTNDNQPTVNSGNSSKDDTTSQNSSKDDVSSDDTSSGNSSDKNNVSYYDDAEEGGNAWDEVDNSSITSSGGNNVTTAKEFDLKSVKQLVFPKYNSSYLTTLALQELQATYKSKAKLDLKIVKDNAGTKDYELLVGKTSRTTATKVTAVDSYRISWKGTKLMIDGGSPKAINAAIAVLNQKIQDGDFILKNAISGKCGTAKATVGAYTEALTDDFEGNTLASTWKPTAFREGGSLDRNKTKKTYMTGVSNAHQVKGGKLYQWAKLREQDGITKEGDVTVYNIERSKLQSQDTFWFQYGYTEASFKVAKGDGMGSGYWLHGYRGGLGSLYCEYDIVEIFGNSKYNQYSPLAWKVVDDDNGGLKNLSSLYADTPNNNDDYNTVTKYYLDDKASLGDEFHTFGMEWDKDYYTFTFDGEVLKKIKYSDMPESFETMHTSKAEMIHCYRQPVYAILSIACGTQTWVQKPYGISDISKLNWVDDNIQAFDYFTLYQKSGQVTGKNYTDISGKIK